MADEQGGKKPMFASMEEAEAQVKNLQRELQKQRDRNRALQASSMAAEEAVEETRGLTDLVTTLLERSSLGEADDNDALPRLKARVQVNRTAGQARREIVRIADEADVDESDPSLDKAWELFTAGKHAEAVQAAKDAVKKDGAGIQTAVQAAVSAELQRLGVKTVDSGQPAPSGIPTDVDTMRERLADPAWRRAHMKEALEAIKAGRVK